MLDSHYSFFNDDIFLFPFTPQSYLEFYIAKKVTYYTLKVVLDIIFSINYGFEGENVVGYKWGDENQHRGCCIQKISAQAQGNPDFHFRGGNRQRPRLRGAHCLG